MSGTISLTSICKVYQAKKIYFRWEGSKEKHWNWASNLFSCPKRHRTECWESMTHMALILSLKESSRKLRISTRKPKLNFSKNRRKKLDELRSLERLDKIQSQSYFLTSGTNCWIISELEISWKISKKCHNGFLTTQTIARFQRSTLKKEVYSKSVNVPQWTDPKNKQPFLKNTFRKM